MKPHVLLINVHGGFPSALIGRSLTELESFSHLCRDAVTYERMYPTNVCAAPALHDTVMDAPLASLTDNVRHSWGRQRQATRTIFHLFRQQGYDTRLYGAYGLDARLDARANMKVGVDERQALHAHGVDVCATADTAFADDHAPARDADTLRRLLDDIEAANDTGDGGRPRLSMVNLLGCQDVERFCVGGKFDADAALLPTLSFDATDDKLDQRQLSKSVLEDDPRRAPGRTPVDALRRLVLLHDSLHGIVGEKPCDDATVSANVIALHRHCWRVLQRIDDALLRVVQALHRKGLYKHTNIYLYSDHAVGLYEHGVTCETPWESCLRCFLVRKSDAIAADTRVVEPISLSELPSIIFSVCKIPAVWHVTRAPASRGCLPLGAAASRAARAAVPPETSAVDLQTFFVRMLARHHDRHYSVIAWFSLSDLAGGEAKVARLAADGNAERQADFANPLRKHSLAELRRRGHALQIYEHESDPHELDNLAGDAEWLENDVSRQLKQQLDRALAHHRLESIRFVVPAQVATFGPERVTFAGAQRRPTPLAPPPPAVARPAHPPKPVRSVSTQTDGDDVGTLSEALARAYGNGVARSCAEHGRLGGAVTVFVPKSTADAPAPAPLVGAYTRDDMTRLANEKAEVMDVLSKRHRLLSDKGRVVLRHWQVLLESAVTMVHSKGFAVGYDVVAHNTDERPTISSSPAPTPSVDQTPLKRPRTTQQHVRPTRGGKADARHSVRAKEIHEFTNRR